MSKTMKKQNTHFTTGPILYIQPMVVPVILLIATSLGSAESQCVNVTNIKIFNADSIQNSTPSTVRFVNSGSKYPYPYSDVCYILKNDVPSTPNGEETALMVNFRMNSLIRGGCKVKMVLHYTDLAGVQRSDKWCHTYGSELNSLIAKNGQDLNVQFTSHRDGDNFQLDYRVMILPSEGDQAADQREKYGEACTAMALTSPDAEYLWHTHNYPHQTNSSRNDCGSFYIDAVNSSLYYMQFKLYDRQTRPSENKDQGYFRIYDGASFATDRMLYMITSGDGLNSDPCQPNDSGFNLLFSPRGNELCSKAACSSTVGMKYQQVAGPYYGRRGMLVGVRLVLKTSVKLCGIKTLKLSEYPALIASLVLIILFTVISIIGLLIFCCS